MSGEAWGLWLLVCVNVFVTVHWFRTIEKRLDKLEHK